MAFEADASPRTELVAALRTGCQQAHTQRSGEVEFRSRGEVRPGGQGQRAAPEVGDCELTKLWKRRSCALPRQHRFFASAEQPDLNPNLRGDVVEDRGSVGSEPKYLGCHDSWCATPMVGSDPDVFAHRLEGPLDGVVLEESRTVER